MAKPPPAPAIVTRRNVLTGGYALAFATAAYGVQDAPTGWRSKFAAVERASGGTLGACVLDTASGRAIGWRENERFAHCSSFKLSLAALIFHLHERGAIALDERLRYTQADLVPNSPATQAHLATGMTVRELAHAAVLVSDNAAANLLLRKIGGPARLTAYWRALGDEISRLDRFEPELNLVPPGEVRDTTTPAAMAHTLARLLTGPALGQQSRQTLIDWMAEVQTGLHRIRAGLPTGWKAGDKTGTGDTLVDVAWIEPPRGAMLIVTGYFRPAAGAGPDIAARGEQALAEIGRIAASWAGSHRKGGRS